MPRRRPRNALGIRRIPRGPMRPRRGRFDSPGFSLMEVLIALTLAMVALVAAAPAIALSMRILVLHQAVVDRESAFEAAWHTVLQDPAGASQEPLQVIEVGDDRRVEVLARPVSRSGPLEVWILSLPGGQYLQERWIAY